ncbi:hypothetical protein MYCTH_2062291 [Thermothelomyces thermophilus ATCC 42464]|uniref:Rhodanese domain-containing protein n=1 Tax=Thermothelomyces thermophilus (strain ATCC 42464 / BCRC 31852 / DSM 1799) TaxID=573729 RepID=G2QC72_THET4|nr:uncharacterized protein MYCTH_2062291 [Thermothelomyces thermophilus ATCC 42464]AEO58101.1 hypothetical protein MYCTH_2062291 [Thermothelomyces thermophilus ATCC 42464]
MEDQPSFMTLRTRRPENDEHSMSSADSAYGSATEGSLPATHDISRVSYHVRHIESFAQALQHSASRAFPNRGRSQRYAKVIALLLHWKSDDLFVLPELEDLEKCFREHYNFETDIFPIPSENSHLELMLKIGDMVKQHEAEDTLFIVYYGGHARIDEARQSTWCANRRPESPWLQWSAIQTLLERSVSDVMILLDCCAGAASATFPTGKTSITETISASSWDAIAPDPGRYSFTNSLIEVLEEWRQRTFSAAMLHAEILARLKHPRPILINGKHFEARSTPVHFMMTSNHRAPSIELCRLVPRKRLPPSPPNELTYWNQPVHPRMIEGRNPVEQYPLAPPPPDFGIPDTSEPNEDEPHVLISLALEDDQRLDLNDWETWLASFPAIAKYVKVQGVFKSHSTLLLLSLPVMVWDFLPDDPACSFVAFIRSNNLIGSQKAAREPESTGVPVSENVPASNLVRDDAESCLSGTTYGPNEGLDNAQQPAAGPSIHRAHSTAFSHYREPRTDPRLASHIRASVGSQLEHPVPDASSPPGPRLEPSLGSLAGSLRNAPSTKEYFQKDPEPNIAVVEHFASNLGVETSDIHGVLLVDLRSSTDFERSHIHDAINLRAPVSFVENTSLEMIEDTFMDDQSRRSFSKWSQFKCVVFYDRVIEFDWECPVAEALYNKFRRKGWQGQCFILKGHYREFSASFDKYISGAKMTSEAKEYLDSLRQQPSPTEEEARKRDEDYREWLDMFTSQHRTPTADLIPARKSERRRTVEQRQKELEVEFEARFPALYKKSQAMRSAAAIDHPPPSPPPRSPPPPFPSETGRDQSSREVDWAGPAKHHDDHDDDDFDLRKAPLVGPLASALDKMREASNLACSNSGTPSQSFQDDYPVKPRADYFGDEYDHDYDEIDPKSEGLGNDPGFQNAGIPVAAESCAGAAARDDTPREDTLKKASKKRPQLWERLRGAGAK